MKGCGHRNQRLANNPAANVVHVHLSQKGCLVILSQSYCALLPYPLAAALSLSELAAPDDRPRPGREPTTTIEAKAWLVDLACRKAKECGYPHASMDLGDDMLCLRQPGAARTSLQQPVRHECRAITQSRESCLK